MKRLPNFSSPKDCHQHLTSLLAAASPAQGCQGAQRGRGGEQGCPPSCPSPPPSIHLGSQRLVWEMLLLQPAPSGLTPGQWFLSHKPLFLSCSSGLMSPFFFLLFYYLHFEDSSKSPHFCFFCPLPLLLFLSANSIMDFICN